MTKKYSMTKRKSTVGLWRNAEHTPHPYSGPRIIFNILLYCLYSSFFVYDFGNNFSFSPNSSISIRNLESAINMMW